MGCLDQVCKCKTRLSLMRLRGIDFSPSACRGIQPYLIHAHPPLIGKSLLYGFFGGTSEIRTRDQRIKSPLLYRLSYRPLQN